MQGRKDFLHAPFVGACFSASLALQAHPLLEFSNAKIMSLLLVFSAPYLPYRTHSSVNAMPLKLTSGEVPILDPGLIWKLHRGPSGREKANCN
jgi:hypothetical protein